MKTLFIIILLLPLTAAAQSPYTGIRFRLEELMYHGDTCKSVFSLTVNKYEPTEVKSIIKTFGRDTSKYDWSDFQYRKDVDFTKKIFYETTKETYVMDVAISNQVYAFENAFGISISRLKCDVTEYMTIYFPVKISSFITFINLGTVYFKPGEYWLLEDLKYSTNGKEMHITLPDNYWVQ